MMLLLLHDSTQAHVHTGDAAISLLPAAIVVAAVALIAFIALRGVRALRRTEAPTRQQH